MTFKRLTDKATFQRVGCYAILDPQKRHGDRLLVGKVWISYPISGDGKLEVNLVVFGDDLPIQYNCVCGFGYNKINAAMEGLIFHGVELGENWEAQLHKLDYVVEQML